LDQKPLDTLEIEENTWKVYELGENELEYIHFPFSIAADLAQRIIIRYSEEDNMYDFVAEEYAEIYGSGGWEKWDTYSDEVKSTCLADAIRRIGNK